MSTPASESPTVDINGAEFVVGVKRSTIASHLAAGKFPQGIKIGRRRVWLKAELIAWLEAGAPPAAKWSAMKSASKSSK